MQILGNGYDGTIINDFKIWNYSSKATATDPPLWTPHMQIVVQWKGIPKNDALLFYNSDGESL